MTMQTPRGPDSAVNRRLTAIWLVAGALTTASWAIALAVDAGHAKASTTVAVIGLALGAVKVRLIVQQFMDVRTAPRWLTTFTVVWLAVLSVSIFAMYLAA
jgi:heme/copper-type cytochrome/quinol oxidase subunit 4